MVISSDHRELFDSIRKQLTAIGHRESTFIRVELLFFEALGASRQYGVGTHNPLHATLKQVESEEYQLTTGAFHKAAQREKVIRHFIVKFKNTLSDFLRLKPELQH